MIFKVWFILLTFLTHIQLAYLPVQNKYEWSFPYDHGAHLDYEIEWWYFTGHLFDEQKNPFGFELTFFRFGNEPKKSKNPFAFKHFYVTHFTLTDEKRKTFHQYEWAHRELPGVAEAREGGLDVATGPFQVKQQKDGFVIKSKKNDIELNLYLKNSKKIVFHGENGYHKKTTEGAASYYYAMTRLKGTGSLKVGESNHNITKAEAWMDHEIFTPIENGERYGWDWFAIQFDDETELMVYQLRDEDRQVLPTASGSFITKNGTKIPLDFKDFKLKPLTFWEDPQTNIRYPVSWRVQVPKLKIDIVTKATLNEQVVRPRALLRNIPYWEGRCLVEGSHPGKAYVELVGYRKN